MRRVAGAFVAAALVAGSKVAADEPGFDSPPDWLRKPGPWDMLAVLPEEAMESGQGGKAILGCKVSAEGVLFDCAVVEESPPGAGFGRAALAMTPQFLMRPALKNGKPVESTVRIPLNFPDMPRPFGPVKLGSEYHRVMRDPDWVAAPSQAAMAAAYPAKARATRAGGTATLACVFNDLAKLKDCTVLQEEPEGIGFGKAAKSLAGGFTGPAAFPDKEPIAGAATQIRFTFAPDTSDGQDELVMKPRWLDAPETATVQASFPAAAIKAGVATARVTLGCRVGPDGRLGGCEVLREEPAGYGIAAAAESLAPQFRVAIWSTEGAPLIGRKARLPVLYEHIAPPAVKP